MIFSKARNSRPHKSFISAVKLPAFAFALSLAAAPAFAADTTTVGAGAKQGDQIFHQRCVVCHNKQPNDTTPFGPPNLYKVFRGHPALTTAQAEVIIMNGKGQMPSFKAVLTKPEIRSVIAYLRSR